MQVFDLGLKSYEETWDLQKQLLAERIQEKIPDTLVLVEHMPVYTVGRGEKPEGKSKLPIVEVERGGKITFHGPGQLVGYPVFKIHNRDLRYFLKTLEFILIDSLAQVFDLKAKAAPENLKLNSGQLPTGVWIGNLKIASIGIAVKHWVSYHGFALNLNPDLTYFQSINPCGFQSEIVSSVEQILKSQGKVYDPELYPVLKSYLMESFQAFSKTSLGITNRPQSGLDS